jgi:putative PIG3 family NAD(P)H quinone oxidoreductase
MRAIVISKPGGPEVLELRDVPAPEPARGEARVRGRATAVNRADLLQRLGMYPAPPDSPQDIPGLEFAGEVDAIGDGVTEVAVGDRVFGLAGGGTYAEQLVAHARTLVPIPDGLSFRDAAAVPEAFITAYDAMVTQGGLAAGETVLIHAVGSGVGTAAAQIANAIGARAVGTTRTADKLERAKALGLRAGAVAEDGAFAKAVLEAAGGPVDVVLELVGGGYVAEDLRCVAPRGRIIVVGLLAGIRTELDLGTLLRKRISITGTVLRSRPIEEKIEAAQAFRRHLIPLWETAGLAPVVDRAFPLAEAAAAHVYVQSNEGFGKVVLEI